MVETEDSWESDRLTGMHMVENPGYDIISPNEMNSKPGPARTIPFNDKKIEDAKAETLTSADLFSFALQIAHGMVGSAVSEIH